MIFSNKTRSDPRTCRRNLGLTLLETSCVLALSVAAVGATYAYAQHAIHSSKVSAVVNEVQLVKEKVQALYEPLNSYSGLTGEKIVDAGVLPKSMIDEHTPNPDRRITHSFGETISVYQYNVDCTTCYDAFRLTAVGLDKETCVALTAKNWGAGTEQILVNDAGTTNGWQSIIHMDANHLIDECDSAHPDGSRVRFIFK